MEEHPQQLGLEFLPLGVYMEGDQARQFSLTS